MASRSLKNDRRRPFARAGRRKASEKARLKDHAHTLSDFRVPTLSIECEPCGRFGRYTIARLMEKYGDARLTELLYILADCPKARAFSIHDGARSGTAKTAGFDPRLLQTGTGTAQTTAISTAAITAVIFSLVDRSMVSSERVSQPYRRPLVLTL